jgi:hypothetical protein
MGMRTSVGTRWLSEVFRQTVTHKSHGLRRLTFVHTVEGMLYWGR